MQVNVYTTRRSRKCTRIVRGGADRGSKGLDEQQRCAVGPVGRAGNPGGALRPEYHRVASVGGQLKPPQTTIQDSGCDISEQSSLQLLERKASKAWLHQSVTSLHSTRRQGSDPCAPNPLEENLTASPLKAVRSVQRCGRVAPRCTLAVGHEAALDSRGAVAVHVHVEALRAEEVHRTCIASRLLQSAIRTCLTTLVQACSASLRNCVSEPARID